MKPFKIILLSILFTQILNAQNMESTNYQIEGMTMAITNMESMLDFYTKVFHMDFSEKEMFGTILYSGTWGDLKLLFCPAQLAGNTAEQNRHQFDIVVSDLDKIIKTATKCGGEVMGDIVEDENFRSVGIYDPDRNSILFKQLNN